MAILIKDLTFKYPNGFKGLDKINLKIEKGKKTAILGLNGSGKSTLLQHFNGINLPQEGEVSVLGIEVCKSNLKQIRKRVGYLFDYPDHQLFSTTVYKDIKFGLDNFGFPEEEKEGKIQEIARNLGIFDLLEKVPHQLSLGQKKKVATAGVLVLEPEILVCDEPFSGLDGPAITYFKDLLDRWTKDDKTIVFSTHDVDLTYEWADDVIILEEGEAIYWGKVEEVMTRGEVYKATFLQEPILYSLFKRRGIFPRTRQEALKLL